MKKTKCFFRLRYAITSLTAAALLCANLSAGVYAANEEKAQLTSDGDKAAVSLTLSQAAKEEISSIQISLNVKPNTDKAEIAFIPNENLKVKICESRYHSDTGILNIYAVGTEPIFDKSNPAVTLGTVKLSCSDPMGASANVGFVKGSLKYVRGGTLLTYDNGLVYSEGVTVSVGNGGLDPIPPITQPTVTSLATKPPQPINTSENNPPIITSDKEPKPVTQAPVNPAVPTVTEKTENNNNPNPENPPAPVVSQPQYVITTNKNEPQPTAADFSKLKAAVETAEKIKGDDYTEESYKILTEAVKKAKETLSSPLSNQSQIDESLLLLENAMGMLTPKSQNTVQPEITTANSEKPPASENNSGNQTNPPKTEPNNNQDQNKQGFNPLIIVLIVIAAVVGILAVVIIVMNKKKSDGGKHSK